MIRSYEAEIRNYRSHVLPSHASLCFPSLEPQPPPPKLKTRLFSSYGTFWPIFDFIEAYESTRSRWDKIFVWSCWNDRLPTSSRGYRLSYPIRICTLTFSPAAFQSHPRCSTPLIGALYLPSLSQVESIPSTPRLILRVIPLTTEAYPRPSLVFRHLCASLAFRGRSGRYPHFQEPVFSQES